MKAYQMVVFMQGEDASEAMEILNTKGESNAIDYLAQWGCGEGEINHFSAKGTHDSQYISKDNFVLTWNNALGYIGLERIV